MYIGRKMLYSIQDWIIVVLSVRVYYAKNLRNPCCRLRKQNVKPQLFGGEHPCMLPAMTDRKFLFTYFLTLLDASVMCLLQTRNPRQHSWGNMRLVMDTLFLMRWHDCMVSKSNSHKLLTSQHPVARIMRSVRQHRPLHPLDIQITHPSHWSPGGKRVRPLFCS